MLQVSRTRVNNQIKRNIVDYSYLIEDVPLDRGISFPAAFRARILQLDMDMSFTYFWKMPYDVCRQVTIALSDHHKNDLYSVVWRALFERNLRTHLIRMKAYHRESEEKLIAVLIKLVRRVDFLTQSSMDGLTIHADSFKEFDDEDKEEFKNSKLSDFQVDPEETYPEEFESN